MCVQTYCASYTESLVESTALPKEGSFKNQISGILIQSAALSISFVVPKFAATEEEAPLKSGHYNTDISMPAASSNDFNDLAMVLEETALYGFVSSWKTFV